MDGYIDIVTNILLFSQISEGHNQNFPVQIYHDSVYCIVWFNFILKLEERFKQEMWCLHSPGNLLLEKSNHSLLP